MKWRYYGWMAVGAFGFAAYHDNTGMMGISLVLMWVSWLGSDILTAIREHS